MPGAIVKGQGVCLFISFLLHYSFDFSAEYFMSILATAICFVACHGGSADHFSVFAKQLENEGHTVQICATGPAINKFYSCAYSDIYTFSLENIAEEKAADQVAEKCKEFPVVITDMGHSFDIALHKTLKQKNPDCLCLAYYDNPEPWVPGGYSFIASQVSALSDKVLFANSGLATNPIYKEQDVVIDLPLDSRVGIGYYPLKKAQQIRENRTLKKNEARKQFYALHGRVDCGENLCVYVGGNNDVYFEKALPAFLDYLHTWSVHHDTSDTLLVFQQHPGAKKLNLDLAQIQKFQQESSVKLVISKLSTDEVLTFADGVLYYQTSMSPLFALAGIPAISVGHEIYPDILVRNHLCHSASNADSLVLALQEITKTKSLQLPALIQKKLGIQANYFENLKQVFSANSQCVLAD